MSSIYYQNGISACSEKNGTSKMETGSFAHSNEVLETDCPRTNLQTLPQDGSTLADGHELRTPLDTKHENCDGQLDRVDTRHLFENSASNGDLNYSQEQRSDFNQEKLRNCTSFGDEQSEVTKTCYDETGNGDEGNSMRPLKQFEVQSDQTINTIQGVVSKSQGGDQSDMGQSDTSSLCDQENEQVYRQDIPVVPFGVPIVYRPLEGSRSFWSLEYKKVTRDLMKAAGGKLPYQKIQKSGFLSITSPSPEAAKNLLRLETIAGLAVNAGIPNWYAKNVGRISGVPFRYTDSQLLECFSDAGVIHVRRQTTFTRMQDGTTQVSPEDCIILTFRPDIEMPDTISLGFDDFAVHTYLAPPVQCYHCLRFNHSAYQCRSTRHCKVCAGPHSYKECTHKEQPRCANCNGPHTATFSGCPKRREAAMVRRYGNVYYQDWETMSDEASRSPDRRQISRKEGNEDNVRQESAIDDACLSRGGRERWKRRYRLESSGYAEGRPTDDGYSGDSDVAPSSREILPARRSPLSFIKHHKYSRNSRRRFKHGFSRYLRKLERIGVPIFSGPSDN